jgi:rod shape-determining protein MreD
MHKVTRLQVFLALSMALAIHMTVLEYFKIFGAKPDLMLLLTIFFALFLGSRRGLETGVMAGFLKDIFAFDIFGVNMFVLALTGFMVGAVNTKFYRESRSTQFGIVLTFSIISMILHYIMASSVLRFVNLGLMDYLISSIIPASLYTAVVSIPLYPYLIESYRLKDRRQFL